MTLPKVNRSGAPAACVALEAVPTPTPSTGSRHHHSSEDEQSAVLTAGDLAQTLLVKPGAGGTTPMLPGRAP